jgi:hypothetical protein
MVTANDVPWEVYRVRRGESLVRIAARMALGSGPGDWREILQMLQWLNPWVRSSDPLRPGDAIVVPLMGPVASAA